MTQYRIVGTKTSHYCTAAKGLLDNCGIAAEVETISMDEARARGYTTVPQIWHGDEYVGGYNDLMAMSDRTERGEFVLAPLFYST